MFRQFDWLALEVRNVDTSLAWYADVLDLTVRERGPGSAALTVGAATLRLCEPGVTPRGGVHVHYALEIAPDAFEEWTDRLSRRTSVTHHDFGGLRSVYVDDPDGHCVELATAADPGSGMAIGDPFEVVLEVMDLDQAEALYRDLGATVTGRGDDRRRVRMDAGAIDIELWEPQTGIAGGRGGLHVTFGGRSPALDAMAERLREHPVDVESIPSSDGATDPPASGVRIRDPDGHVVELYPAAD